MLTEPFSRHVCRDGGDGLKLNRIGMRNPSPAAQHLSLNRPDYKASRFVISHIVNEAGVRYCSRRWILGYCQKAGPNPSGAFLIA